MTMSKAPPVLPLLAGAVGPVTTHCCKSLCANSNGGYSSLPLCRFRGMHENKSHQRQRQQYPTPMQFKRQTMTSARRGSTTSKMPAKSDHFLIPGFQPRAITSGGDDNNLNLMNMMSMGAPSPGTLPILDAAVILSPGRYCKKSSWSASYHRDRGTKSGIDAAQRLIRARREFMDLIQTELLGIQCNDDMRKANHSTTRKMYALTGHGVPNGLLRHFTNMARSWLRLLQINPTSTILGSHDDNSGHIQQPISTIEPLHHDDVSSSSPPPPPMMKILLTNSPKSTLLDQSRVQFIDAHNVTTNAPSFPSEWEYDFEMYMVVMDRMGSRLAAVATPPPIAQPASSSSTSTTSRISSDIDNPTHYEQPLHDNDEFLRIDPIATGRKESSILIPASLQQWNVTIMNGEALPRCLLPKNTSISSSTNNRRIRGEGKDDENTNTAIPNLSMEWVKTKDNNDCWKVILRLQDSSNCGGDDGGTKDDGLINRTSVSLVFEGEYHMAPL